MFDTRSVIILSVKGRQGKRKSSVAQPSSGLSPEAQSVGWGLIGVSGFVVDVREILSGRSSLRWYDQILHVIGALIILGLLIGGVSYSVLRN